VEHVTSILGFSLLSYVRASYSGFAFTHPQKNGATGRKERSRLQALKADLNRQLGKLPEGVAFTFSPPAIPGVGTSGGFTFILEDRSGQDVQFSFRQLEQVHGGSSRAQGDRGLSTTFLPSVPQQFVEVDRDKVIKQGRPDQRPFTGTIQTFMGGLFINYFQPLWTPMAGVRRGPRETIEPDPRNVGQFYVRNAAGEMGSAFGADAIRIQTNGPEFTMRFNEVQGGRS